MQLIGHLIAGVPWPVGIHPGEPGAGQPRADQHRAGRHAAGLSTNPSGATPTVADLVSDVRLTSSEVTGYWLNVPSPSAGCPKCGQPEPQIGYELLTSLAQ